MKSLNDLVTQTYSRKIFRLMLLAGLTVSVDVAIEIFRNIV